jgi:hypothetical protein
MRAPAISVRILKQPPLRLQKSLLQIRSEMLPVLRSAKPVDHIRRFPIERGHFPQHPPFMLPRPLAPLFFGLGRDSGGPLWEVCTTFSGFTIVAGLVPRPNAMMFS